MPISNPNFCVKDSATSCVLTNSLASNWRGQDNDIVFDDLWSKGTCIKLVATKTVNFG